MISQITVGYILTISLILQLFENQTEYFDIPNANRTVLQTREKLIDLAVTVVGDDKRVALKDLLTYKSTPNGGVAVTDDLKYTGKYTFH